MSGVGSTNAMKKGSANNPFLAYSEADMQSFLNSAYTGCIVKYAGEPISRYLTEQNKTVPEHVKNLVFSPTDGGFWTFFDRGNIRIKIQQKTNGSTKTLYITPGRFYNGAWHFDKLSFTNSNLYLTDSLTAPTETLIEIQKYFSTEPYWRWNKECVNDQGNLTIWTYDQDVTFTIEQATTEYGIAYDSTHGITIVPYKVNELYKVVYSDGKYYYEEFCHISDTRTTANSDYIAPGKTAFDFTGNLQTGNGSKINPYLAYTVAEFQSFPVGSFIKWLGPGKTVIDTTTGQMLIHGEVYRAVEDGDTFQYVILPTLSNPGTAADLAQGKQLIDGDGKVVEGEAEFSFGDYSVKVVDYDGTVLMEKKGNTGDIIDLPVAPVHDKLVFQGWSASVDVSNNKVTIADNDVMVGVVYTTASGQNEFDITLTKVTGLSVTVNIDGTKDWGDSTSDTATTHTYTAYGDYTIKCNGTITKNVFGSTDSAPNYYCKKARLVTNIGTNAFYDCFSLNSITLSNVVTRIGNTAFYNCMSLTNVIIPNSVISVGTGVFQNCHSLNRILIPNSITNIQNSIFDSCYSLDNIILPNSVTIINPYAFANCYSLQSIIITDGVTEISTYVFSRCYSLNNIVLPDSVTVIGNGAFAYCYSLTNIILPNSITQIKDYAFQGCYSLIKYDFSQCSSVPTLSNVNVFNNINKICKIIVPDSLYDEWIAASQWIGYSSYIYKASEEVTQ